MEQILIATNTNKEGRGICQLLLDSYSNTLSHLKQVIFEKNPTYLIFDHHNHLFIASKHDSGGGIASHYVNDNYDKLDRVYEEASAPIMLTMDHEQHRLFSLHHNGHLYSYSINDDGTLYKEDMFDVQKEIASFIVTPDHHLLVACDNEPVLFLIQYDQRGKLSQLKTFRFEGIEGYQHLVLHPHHQYIYATSQNSHRLHIFYYGLDHVMHEVTSLNTLPQHAKGQCIGLIIDKQSNHLYCLNRGTNTISHFHITKDGQQLTYVQSISTEGLAPHCFNFNADQNYLLVANELSHNLTLFKRNHDGKLSLCSHDTAIPDTVYILSSEN